MRGIAIVVRPGICVFTLVEMDLILHIAAILIAAPPKLIRLPHDRSFSSLVIAMPGVTAYREARLIVVNMRHSDHPEPPVEAVHVLIVQVFVQAKVVNRMTGNEGGVAVRFALSSSKNQPGVS